MLACHEGSARGPTAAPAGILYVNVEQLGYRVANYRRLAFAPAGRLFLRREFLAAMMPLHKGVLASAGRVINSENE